MMADIHKASIKAASAGAILGWFLTAFVFYPPHSGWGMGVHWGDVATWFAGAGTFAAAIAALWIAGTDRRERKQQKTELASTAGEFLYCDLQWMLIHANLLQTNAIRLANLSNGEPYSRDVEHSIFCIEQIRAITARTDLERMSLLPAHVCGPLARAMGGFQYLLASSESTFSMLKINAPLDNYRDKLADYANDIPIQVVNLRSFFEWYGELSEEAKQAVGNPCLEIIDSITSRFNSTETGNPLTP
jgi:hypothetical protein